MTASPSCKNGNIKSHELIYLFQFKNQSEAIHIIAIHMIKKISPKLARYIENLAWFLLFAILRTLTRKTHRHLNVARGDGLFRK